MAEPHEQQTITILQSHSNESISHSDLDMNPVSKGLNRLSVDQGNTIVSLLQGMQQTINRVDETVKGVEERVKRIEDKVHTVEDKVFRVGEMVKRVEEKIEQVEMDCQRNTERVKHNLPLFGANVERNIPQSEEKGEGNHLQFGKNTHRQYKGLFGGPLYTPFANPFPHKSNFTSTFSTENIRGTEPSPPCKTSPQRLEQQVEKVGGGIEAEVKQMRQDINYIFKDLDFMPIRIQNSRAPENSELRYPRHIIPAYPPLPHSMQELGLMTDAQRQAAATYLELPALPNYATERDRWMQLVRYLGGEPLLQEHLGI